MKNILPKLNKIQSELKAPKGQFNNFGKYKYRSCEDILESVKPLLQETKCVLAVSDELVQMGERYYIKATATIYDSASGESLSNQALAREEETKKGMDGSQITGTASSYARKYALNGLLAIDDTKDADATNTHDKEPKNQTIGKPQDETIDTANAPVDKINIAAMLSEMKRTGIKEKQILLTFKVDKINELNKGQFVEAMKLFDKQPDRKPVDLDL